MAAVALRVRKPADHRHAGAAQDAGRVLVEVELLSAEQQPPRVGAVGEGALVDAFAQVFECCVACFLVLCAAA